MSAAGSDAWIGPDQSDEGDPLYDRATNFFAMVNWNAVISSARRLRNEIECSLSDKYSLGHFNMVRRIDFVDGMKWVVRLRLPVLKAFGDPGAANTESIMNVEVATMKFLRKHISFPVPEILGYDFSSENEIGAPFMFLSYIHGTTAEELHEIKNCEFGTFGTKEQDKQFRLQLAKIHVELASLQFDKIGSIHLDDRNNFYIGTDIETDRGPWSTPSEYYDDYIEYLLKETEKPEHDPGLRQCESFNLPSLFKELIQIYARPHDLGPFGLANLDFGAHNVLVNDDFEIIGLIDLDGVLAAPPEIVAQFPYGVSVQQEPPGLVTTSPWVQKRIEFDKPFIKRYIEDVKALELALNAAPSSCISSYLQTEATSLISGLRYFANYSKVSNDENYKSFQFLLDVHNGKTADATLDDKSITHERQHNKSSFSRDGLGTVQTIDEATSF